MTGIERPRWGRRTAGLAVLLTGALARTAEADPSAVDRLELTWSAVEGCPSQADVLAEVKKLLEAATKEDESEGTIRVAATARRDAGGSFVVRLETPGEGATQARELRGATCKAVADATALILALMIDPDAAARDEETPSETREPENAGRGEAETSPEEQEEGSAIAPRLSTASSPASRAAPRPPQEPAPRAPPGSRQSFELRLGAWTGVDIGSLPGLAPGFGALGSVAFGGPRIAAGVAFWPDKSGFLEDLPSAGSNVALLAGELGICGAILEKPIEIAPCASVEIGELYATGFNVVNPRRGGAIWVALKGGGALVWRPFQGPLEGLGLTARVEAVIPLVRPRFVIEGIGPVHSPAYVAGRGALGIEVSL